MLFISELWKKYLTGIFSGSKFMMFFDRKFGKGVGACAETETKPG